MNNTVMLVDDERNILSALSRVLRGEGYNILLAENGETGLDLLRSNSVAVVVSDHRMPGMDGVEFLQRIKEKYPQTVRFMLTGCADLSSVVKSINKGEVYRFLTKPWDDDEIKSVVKSAVERYNLVEENRELIDLTRRQNALLMDFNQKLEERAQEKTARLRENFFAFVGLCADIMEMHDRSIGSHSKRVAALSRGVAMKMKNDGVDTEMIWAAAILHNIGLVGVPADVLEREEAELTECELALIRNNPVLSQDLLTRIDNLRQAGMIIRGQSENYDGSGYPDGLYRERIHTGSRIIAVCKAYDRLRHGGQRLSRAEALDRLGEERGRCFDPAVLDALEEHLAGVNEDDSERIPEGRGRLVHAAVGTAELTPGMILTGDLLTKRGKLLVTKGTALTAAIIEKVLNFNRIDPVSGPVHVMVRLDC